MNDVPDIAQRMVSLRALDSHTDEREVFLRVSAKARTGHWTHLVLIDYLHDLVAAGLSTHDALDRMDRL